MEVAVLKRHKDVASVGSEGGVRAVRGRERRACRCE